MLTIGWEELPAASIQLLKNIDYDFGCVVGFACSDQPPEPKNLVLPLISRLPRVIRAESPWLQALKEVVDFAASQDLGIVASAGSTGWEYAAWLANIRGALQWIVLPAMPFEECESARSHLREQLNLSGTVRFLIPLTGERISRHTAWQIRDRLAFAVSGIRFGVAVSTTGNWSKLAAVAEVEWKYNQPIERPPLPRWKRDGQWQVGLQRHDWAKYIIHWTKGSDGPWPGESLTDYFRDLNRIKIGAPRDAFATLCRIAGEKRIRASGRLISGRTPMVCFSELPPKELLSTIGYRNSLGRWKFEPYGVAIVKETAIQLGANPVTYITRGQAADQNTKDGFRQYVGDLTHPDVTRHWVREMEWRLAGDLNFGGIADQIKLVVPFADEAVLLRKRTDLQVLSFEEQ